MDRQTNSLRHQLFASQHNLSDTNWNLPTTNQMKSFHFTGYKILWENACNQYFLLFLQCFQMPSSLLASEFSPFLTMFSNAFFLGPFNPFPLKNTFWRPWETNLLKTLWEKEKLLVTSNFSFSHSVFYLFGQLSFIFFKFQIVVCKLFQFGRV